ncbi:MAG: hypothetical protein EFKGCFLK_00540 [Rhodocyclaceae bacterium]|nr:MAG: hypothetical protein F9K21_08095 [Rhodocyclaceae bacterium]MBE7423883.1 hypothetical protein [Zoogloeaceae bacterium]CAG0944572.1 hypothetical protein GPROT2_02714 [Gammaproteobacteria bacterium]MBV6406991.1 hypothetical protein [Rhodocyclaceae bacterium]MBZ0145785.1 hypothetical protein [Rhodocyclaceae bacterium]
MNPIVSAILSSIIDSILESAMTPAPALPPSAPPGVVRPALGQGPLAMMTPPNNGFAQFGNETLRLSASLQIRDTQNRIVMPMTMQGAVPVLYKLDEYGSVQRVWVLTPEEAEVADQLIKQKKSESAAPK